MNILIFVALIAGTANLQARYYISTSFDRPLHLAVLTLAIAGLVSYIFAKSLGLRYAGSRKGRHELPAAVTTLGLRDNLKSCLRSISRPNGFIIIVLLVVVRTLLNWRIVRTIQCSWDGFYAFLPFFLSIYEHLTPTRPIHLPRPSTTAEDDDEGPSRAPVVRFAVLALLWAFATTRLSFLTANPTGVICPTGWFIEGFIPLAQLIAALIDAAIISQVARLRQASQDVTGDPWQTLGALSWTSAAVISFLTMWSYFDPVNSVASVILTPTEIRDVVLDSVVAALTFVVGVYLLGSFQAHLVLLVTTGAVVFVSIVSTPPVSASNSLWFEWVATAAIVFVGFGALFHFRRTNTPLGTSLLRELHTPALGRYCVYALATLSLVLFYASFHTRGKPVVSPKHAMIAGRIESNNWVANAATSTSLESAIKEYRLRYGISPPPYFDKWYEFAKSAKSPIIDSFDQIKSDLLPFWAITPALLRQRTTHLLEHPYLSMGGLIIKNGTTSISPHIHGTHRWMMDVVEEMVKPFSQWLPDMQLAFNLDDECRVPIPADDSSYFKVHAQEARSRAQSKQSLASFSYVQRPPWDESFLGADDSIWQQQSDSFQVYSKKSIFADLVAPSCPADAPVNQLHWWNRKASCEECAIPHMQDGFVRNWTLAADLCHQPDVAHLHGFLTSPAAMGASQTLFPVFSQAKVHNFADILYPSPWSFHDKAPFEEEKDVPWEQKLNSVYWRGASSDGFSVYGSWQMFLRARFVKLASTIEKTVSRHGTPRFFKRHRPSLSATDPALSKTALDRDLQEIHGNTLLPEPLHVNVSFVGPFFSRCEGRDCATEHATFYGSTSAEPPQALDFQETWKHRHLIDLDGAGFSGRFLPFLQSGSLPYRAALFRTWWEERVHPWKHYVPLDLRLKDFWPAVEYFGGGRPDGAADAKEIAVAGQEWAKRALRKEDMQVYMFRLLLEWGRLVDDERENIGFSFA
ncbi:hypothetical protein F5Y08DRAFT_321544 [Xylaria arbuscula]|nr:hypothetical protein F5Y08DRAFT_321544 [Xylaria arbuscula]